MSKCNDCFHRMICSKATAVYGYSLFDGKICYCDLDYVEAKCHYFSDKTKVREALEILSPKKPIPKKIQEGFGENINIYWDYVCPNKQCNCTVYKGEYKCPKCGQWLDWK